MLHRMHFEWPALSFDFVSDPLGAERWRYPHTAWLVEGSSGADAGESALNVVRVANMVRTKRTDEDELDEVTGALRDDLDDVDVDPTLENRSFPLDGGANRVRCDPTHPNVVAVWSETGRVHLYDVGRALQTLQHAGAGAFTQGQGGVFHTFQGHRGGSERGAGEGFAMDWSRVKPGRLATGDCAGRFFVWEVDSSRVAVDAGPYTGHAGSVEDVQWSPTEESVLASCSTDGTVKIWDTRAPKTSSMLSERAHERDVNVVSWNHRVAFLLASGSDDASFKVWDLRNFKASNPVGWFKTFHTDAVSSIQWSPHDESVLAVSSADELVTLWDLALEEDREHAEAARTAQGVVDEHGRAVELPPQLLFVHAGLAEPMEVRFHPHVVGLLGATGSEGFDAFIAEPLERAS